MSCARHCLAATIAVLLLLPLSAAAGGPAGSFGEGRLWRISKPGAHDSFVLGTIHVADPRVSRIAKPVEDALARSRTLATEIALGAVVDARVFELEEFDDGRRLEPLIGPQAFARLRDALAAHGVPQARIERLKPWAAMLKASQVPSGADDLSLDQRLVAMAQARRMRVAALEWVEEQIAAFDAVPLATQVALLKHVLEHREALAARLEATIEAWLRGDLAGLARLAQGLEKAFPGMGRHYSELTRHIIHNRTVAIHHRLFMPLREGRVFVAVGAMHLSGEKGLLAMLVRDGYRATRIW